MTKGSHAPPSAAENEAIEAALDPLTDVSERRESVLDNAPTRELLRAIRECSEVLVFVGESLWAVTKAEARRHVREQQWSAGGYEINGYIGQASNGALMVSSSEGEPMNPKHRDPHA